MIDLLERIESLSMLFFACVVSGLGFPVPEDALLLYAGIRVADGRFEAAHVIVVVLAGVVLRDLLAWCLGRFLGDRLLSSPRLHRLLPAPKIERARSLVAAHGARAVVLGRFMVGFRVPVFIAAGAARVPLGTFLLADGLAMLVGVPLEVALGAYLGPPVIDLAARAVRGSGAVWVGVLLVAAALATWRRRARRAA